MRSGSRFDGVQMTKDSRPTAVDLFSGAGGLSHGLKNAGFLVVGAVEIDPSAARSYALNHPEVPLHARDISKITGPEILDRTSASESKLDLLAACPPCQGFSTIRTRNASRSARDERNALIHHVTRLARSLRPRAILLENVPSVQRSLHFKRFVADLVRAGFTCEWSVVDASDYGVPQRRKRLVFIAVRQGTCPEVNRARDALTVRDAIGSLAAPSRSRDKLHAYRVRMSDAVGERIRAIPVNGGSRSELPKRLQLACHQKTTGFRARLDQAMKEQQRVQEEKAKKDTKKEPKKK